MLLASQILIGSCKIRLCLLLCASGLLFRSEQLVAFNISFWTWPKSERVSFQPRLVSLDRGTSPFDIKPTTRTTKARSRSRSSTRAQTPARYSCSHVGDLRSIEQVLKRVVWFFSGRLYLYSQP
jgi:hypothetical protein